MNKLRTILKTLLNILAGGSFLVMVVLTVWQVVTRYVLNNPSSWTEELVSYMFAWMSLLGAALVTSESGHMNIPILLERLGVKGQKLLNILSELTAFFFSAIILLYGGLQISTLAMGQMTSSLGVPIGVFYFVMPLCGILNMVFTALNIIDIVRGNTQKEEK